MLWVSLNWSTVTQTGLIENLPLVEFVIVFFKAEDSDLSVGLLPPAPDAAGPGTTREPLHVVPLSDFQTSST